MHAEVLGQKDGEEGKREAETEDRRELGKPKSSQVAPPVDTARVDRRRRRPVGRDGEMVDHRVGIAFSQCIFDGVRDGRRHRDGPALAGALEAFRIGVGRRLDVDQHRFGADLAGADDRVVEEARSAKAAVRVIDRGLEERVAEAVCVTAVHLALHDQLVDGLAGVMRDDVAQNLDLAGVGVDGDHRGVASARIGQRPLGIKGLQDLEAFLRHHLRHAHAFGRRAANRDHAVFDHEVRGIGFEHVSRPFEQTLPQRGRGFGGRVADLDGAPTARRELGGRHLTGVGGGDLDLLERPAQPIGRHLRGDGLVTLALRRRTDI